MDGEVFVNPSFARPLRGLLACAAVALAMAGASPIAAAAQAGRSATEEGNRLYEEGRFDEAHRQYLEALGEAPDSPLIRFNDGSALYKEENFDESLEAFRQAIESGDSSFVSDAWYNVGGALYRQKQLPEALEAYKQALRANPRDIDAKHNLERVLEQMKQPQDQQKKPDDQNQKPDNQNKPDDQSKKPDDQNKPDEQPSEGGQPPPGQMTREEAERLLGAIQEDQDKVDRKPRTAARGPRPKKDW